MRALLLPSLAAALLLAGCSEKPAAPPPAPPAAAPVAAAPAPADIPTPDITISTSAPDIAKGEVLFSSKGCVACHKMGGGKLVGPDLKGVLGRRPQEWVEKMILRPDLMLKDDVVARKLLAEHLVPMPNQGVDAQSELPFLLAYLQGAR